MEEMFRLLKMKQQGFYCSQILMKMALEEMGKENTDLIRSMGALSGGLGFTGEICGGLSGGACVLGLYAGKGLPDEKEDPRLFFMIEDLVDWFKDSYIEAYGGIRCEEILGGKPKGQGTPCPAIVMDTFQKVKELLVENGFDLSGLTDDE